MDIITILSLASSAAGTVNSATNTVDKLRLLIKGDQIDKAAVSEICLDLYGKLIDAKQSQVRLEDLLRALKREIDERNEFDAKMRNYSLVCLPAGGKVYALKDDADEIHHFICPKCVQDRATSILQGAFDYYWLECPTCGNKFAQQRRCQDTVAVDDWNPLDGL